MDITSAVILGIVQGLTEFLPVSSTAHLLIVPKILGIANPGVAFDVMLHLATALAIVMYFFDDIITIITKMPKMIWLLILGSIPTGLMGFFLKDYFESFFHAGIWTGVFLIITGCLLFISEKLATGEKNLDKTRWYDAVIIGFFQGLAIMPGLSRSGSTIAAALFRGLNKTLATRFVFLLALPAILGAGLLEFKEISNLPKEPAIYGFIAALVSGLIAIKIFIQLLQRGKIRIFSWYCWALGIFLCIKSF
ncbi:MAG: undecaprenyl-diphosphate phosphatase [Candidatus Margulisiibacteriota bacterium]